MVQYKGKPGFIKCTNRKDNFDRERMALEVNDYAYSLNNQEKYDILPFVFYQIVEGIKYMNSLGLVHGDIKPESKHGSVYCNLKNRPIVTIIDFDLSQMVGKSGIAKSRGGTAGYFAPEDTLEVPIDQYKRDTWMVGATLYAALRGSSPYKHVEPLMSAWKYKIELMEKMMTIDPARRPRLDELESLLLESFKSAASTA
ncbi:kinase-like domain-containing protein [Thamnocephalis sphaerospora]|uniref:Kinase-like domain-containing protein n=1 Tax=Thamnocephalis sphaerospora TaxID=78915 RepID=A0A4P9XWN8_9FUNG|nr:kinase-like domain-containing protein [Thamnocephalis sphaerospora]|eukprot:RKP10754.1 kinase-like domain-containing protein [Thamnocephalis sphaerospora]